MPKLVSPSEVAAWISYFEYYSIERLCVRFPEEKLDDTQLQRRMTNIYNICYSVQIRAQLTGALNLVQGHDVFRGEQQH
jgi:hypothetical protein